MTARQYKVPPVAEARKLAESYGKDVVVITAYDFLNNRYSSTTYGNGTKWADAAANLGNILMKAAEPMAGPKEVHEDFRKGILRKTEEKLRIATELLANAIGETPLDAQILISNKMDNVKEPF